MKRKSHATTYALIFAIFLLASILLTKESIDQHHQQALARYDAILAKKGFSQSVKSVNEAQSHNLLEPAGQDKEARRTEINSVSDDDQKSFADTFVGPLVPCSTDTDCQIKHGWDMNGEPIPIQINETKHDIRLHWSHGISFFAGFAVGAFILTILYNTMINRFVRRSPYLFRR